MLYIEKGKSQTKIRAIENVSTTTNRKIHYKGWENKICMTFQKSDSVF